MEEQNKLYVIGNGFDIYHGIKSKYWHFKDYVEKNDKDLFETLEEYFNAEELWSDFETTLAYFDIDSVREYAANYLVDYGAEKWSDAYHHDYQYEIDRIVSLVSTKLKQRFTEWVLQLSIPKKDEIEQLDISVDSTFINFNYTATLEKLYDVSSTSILYIHNKALDTDSNLILGHCWKPAVHEPKTYTQEEIEDMELDTGDTRVNEGEEILNSYFKSTYKPTEQIIAEKAKFFSILKSTTEVFVFGHSLSEVDLIYFKEILKNINIEKVKWTVSYYEAHKIREYRDTLTELGVNEKLLTFKKLEELTIEMKSQIKLEL